MNKFYMDINNLRSDAERNRNNMKPKKITSLLLAGVITITSICTMSPVKAVESNYEVIQNNYEERDLIQYVNPLIGTEQFGGSEWSATAPFVTAPFGMTNFTPQTRLNQVSDISYVYQDTKISGFIATHQPAIWMGDYGSFTIMPQIGDVRPSFDDRKLSFSHDDEISTPYYYSVEMGKNEGTPITGEMTATERCAIYRFTFPKTDEANILIEASRGRYGNAVNRGDGKATIDLENMEVSGWNDMQMTADHTKYPSQKLKCYYVIQFVTDKDVMAKGTYENYKVTENSTQVEGEKSGSYLTFNTEENETIEMRIGTSFISEDQARQNIKLEIGNDDFETVKEELKASWNEKLNRIQIDGATESEKNIFYTAMYHASIYPRKFYETTEDGKDIYFSPYDDEIHEGRSYTDFSLWDTFRAQNSFLTLVYPELVDEIVTSLLQNYQEGGYMPKWPNPGYTNTMIGTHADSVVAEAIKKGLLDESKYELAYEAVFKDAMYPQEGDGEELWSAARQSNLYEARGGLGSYIALGYIYNGYAKENISRTMEFAYDDWCVAQVAKAVGNENDYNYFMNRSMNYKNVINPSTGYADARNKDGSWGNAFEPFTEGNSFVYNWCAMHDPQGLLDLMTEYKGADFYNNELEKGWTERKLRHDNEPSHHYAYMFDFSGRPDLTQKYARKTLLESYSNTKKGQLGNDDCGQMSSWYVFSSMGFYPVNPASGEYMVGSPIFDKVTINNPLEGTQFVIEATNNDDEISTDNLGNCYIESATLNGEALNEPVITHEQITKGGKATFNMTDKATDWASDYRKEAVQYDETAKYPENAPEPIVIDGEAKIIESNLALEAKAEATSYKEVHDGGPAYTFNDGSYDTGYVSENNPAFPQYLTLTWDEPQTFNKLSIYGNYPKSQGIKKFVLEATEDGVNWEAISEEITLNWNTDNSLEQQDIKIDTVGNKVGLRLKVLDAATVWGSFTVREIEVYNSSDFIDLKNPGDITIEIKPYTNKLEGIKCNGNDLEEGKDYTIKEDIVTIKAEFLKTLKADTLAEFEIVYDKGACPVIVIPVRTAANEVIDNSGFQITCDNQNERTGNEGPIELAFDGDPSTHWHSNYTPKQDLPATIEIDMMKEYVVNEFDYLPRRSGDNGNITSYDLYGKLNAEDEYTLISSGTWDKNGDLKKIYFEGIEVRYLKFVAKEGKSDFASAAEFVIYESKEESTETSTNKTALQAAITTANSLKEQGALDNVVPVVVAEFNSALAEAETVYANDRADQATVDTAFYRLANAIHMLEFVKGDKTELASLIEEYSKLEETDYTTTSWEVFKGALDAAIIVNEDENALEYEVENALNDLKAGFEQLVVVADKSALQAMVDKVNGLDEKLYISESWNKLTNPMKKANEVLADVDATQDEVNSAYDALVKAYLELRLIPNKDLLEGLIKQANSLIEANYSKASWNVVIEAKEAAINVLNDTNVTQEEVDSAKEALVKAMAGLQTVETPVANGDTTVSIKTGDDGLASMFGAIALLSATGYIALRKKD